MKKSQSYQLPRISADNIAKNLRKKFPKSKNSNQDKAFQIADRLARNLAEIQPQDINTDLFPISEVKKNQQIWTQVRSLLSKNS